MTLPFGQNFETGKRQYQCFVCGLIQPNWESFKEHIIRNHEEGREYIICPLDRCRTPVRDIRAHYKAKHPSEKIPNFCQMKALVWKDARDPKKRKKKVTFKEGYFPSGKNGGKPMHYRSSYEEDVYKTLEHWNEVAGYDVEPFPIEYYHLGKKHNYIPDLKVRFVDGHTEIWEIKPSTQTGFAINETKWQAANNFCRLRGWGFEVITEQRINKLKKLV